MALCAQPYIYMYISDEEDKVEKAARTQPVPTRLPSISDIMIAYATAPGSHLLSLQ